MSLKLGVCLPCGRPYDLETAAEAAHGGPIEPMADASDFAAPRPWCDDPAPWKRLFARQLDIAIAVLTLETGLLVIAPGMLVIVHHYFITMAALLLWIPVEAAVLARYGTTPGKAILDLRVRRRDGESATYTEYLERSGRVWMTGLALGIPVANLVACAFSYDRLMNHGLVWWDDELGLKVETRPMGFGRTVGATVAFMIAAAWSVLILPV